MMQPSDASAMRLPSAARAAERVAESSVELPTSAEAQALEQSSSCSHRVALGRKMVFSTGLMPSRADEACASTCPPPWRARNRLGKDLGATARLDLIEAPKR